jgi:hypothetical protein
MKRESRGLATILLWFGLAILAVFGISSHVFSEPPAEPAAMGQGQSNFGLFAQTPTTDTVRLYGYMTDLGGVPVPQISVDVYGEGTRLALQAANSSGYYEVSVPRQELYTMVITSRTDRGSYQVNWYVAARQQIRPGNASAMRTDVTLRPSGNLILNAYGASGNLIRITGFRSIVGEHVYVTDLTDQPRYGSFSPVQDAQSRASGSSLDVAVPAFAIPIQTPSRMHVSWQVPDFGKVILDVDNEGRGYTVAEQGGYLVLNFNHEAAKSELVSLRRDYEAFRAQGYVIADAIPAAILTSESHLRSAELYLNSSPPEMSKAITELDLSLRYTLYAQEELHLERARTDILRNRKGIIRLRIVNNTGQPIRTAIVNFQQMNHDFMFGAQPMGKAGKYDPRYADLLRAAGVNYSHIGFQYGSLEPKPGMFEWGGVDNYQNIQAQSIKGFKFLGGQPLWLYRGQGNDWCPLYQDAMSFPELQANVSTHMRTLGARYRDKIDLWEVIGEDNESHVNALNLTWDQKVDLLRSAISGLKAGNAEARVQATSMALPYEFNHGKLENTAVRAGGISFYEYLGLLVSRDISFDVIGLEFYYSGLIGTDFGKGGVPPGLSLASQSRLLDQYAIFGKPLSVRELSAPSFQVPGTSWWHRAWDEETQAEFLEKFYTLAFSKPLVREIAWSHGISDESVFMKGGGILDANLKPKPSYFALKNLIASWTTHGAGTTDANGELVIKGFAGDYQVEVNDGARSKSFRAHINERQEGAVTLTVAEQDWGWAGIFFGVIGIGTAVGISAWVRQRK